MIQEIYQSKWFTKHIQVQRDGNNQDLNHCSNLMNLIRKNPFIRGNIPIHFPKDCIEMYEPTMQNILKAYNKNESQSDAVL